MIQWTDGPIVIPVTERDTEGERERRKQDRERRKNVCVHPHPCGLEPVNTFAEPIIKFSPLVVGVRIQTERQRPGPSSTWYPGERAEAWGRELGWDSTSWVTDRQRGGREVKGRK